MMDRARGDTTTEPSDGRLLVRLAIGALLLGRERLVAEIRACPPASADDEAGTRADDEAGTRAAAPGRRHQLIGAMVVAPQALARVLRSVRGAWERSARRVLGPAWSLVGSTRRGQRIARRIRRVQSQIEHELERWGEIGWVEEQAGRAVAATLLAELYTEVLAEIGESPELQRLIEESSAGLTRSVIGELRERSANADERVESIIRRLRRRH